VCEETPAVTPLDQLDFSTVHVLDGGMATELERRGADISGPLWSARILHASPQTIAEVHRAYLEAGADCISTASYQVSAQSYKDGGYSPEEARQALRQSVRLADEARVRYEHETGRRVLVAASLGPYGAALHNGAEYHGRYDIGFDALVEFHAERLKVLGETSADLIAFETIPSLEEARAILAALHLYRDLGAWLSFTCRDGRHVAHGELLADCGAMLEGEPQVVAVGINCTAPRLVADLLGELRRATSKALIVYPNSGETWDAACRCWRGESDACEFGALAKRWRQAGAQAVGGCCRTGPDHVRAVRAALFEGK
jgi:homocysteine S-methyltransferase